MRISHIFRGSLTNQNKCVYVTPNVKAIRVLYRLLFSPRAFENIFPVIYVPTLLYMRLLPGSFMTAIGDSRVHFIDNLFFLIFLINCLLLIFWFVNVHAGLTGETARKLSFGEIDEL